MVPWSLHYPRYPKRAVQFSLIKLHSTSHSLASSYSQSCDSFISTLSSVLCARIFIFGPSVWGPVNKHVVGANTTLNYDTVTVQLLLPFYYCLYGTIYEIKPNAFVATSGPRPLTLLGSRIQLAFTNTSSLKPRAPNIEVLLYSGLGLLSMELG